MIRRTGASRLTCSGVLVVSSLLTATPVAAQWSQTHEQFYFPASHNWQFRRNYPAADRLFNAFDYGHAILYERLYTEPGAPVASLEVKEFNFITRELLVHPPRVPLEEGAIEVAYAKIAPEAKAMFDWAHVLHRQIYDVWSDERISVSQKDARIAELIRYYKTRKDLAYSSVPKSMELMEGQYYSRAFRDGYPKFNGLIWAYHWLQVGLYEPLVVGKNIDERQTGVIAAVARFRQMLENAPDSMPRLMPMTAAIAPEFSRRYPEAAIIFDNLHAMHDVISDILASPKVPRDRKRDEILRAARRYRDDTSFAISEDEWRSMSQGMGTENMGGPAVAVLRPLPAPTVAFGAGHGAMPMSGSGGMAGMDHSKPATPVDTTRPGTMAGMDHSTMAMPPDTRSERDTAGHPDAATSGMAGHAGMNHPSVGMTGTAGDTAMRRMMQMHMRMMADPVVRARMEADTAMRRLMKEMMDAMPVAEREQMERAMPAPRGPAARPRGKSASAAPPSATPARGKEAPKRKPAKDSMPAMDHSKMPGMKKP